MEVREMMTSNVRTCRATDSINRAAQIMWESDCGCVPVVEDGKVVGIITDRDICMAAYTQDLPLTQIAVRSFASGNVVTVRENDSLHRAERLMHDGQVRRLPVLDSEGRLVGLLSISDFARRVHEIGEGIPGHIVSALAGISQRPSARSGSKADRRVQPRETDAVGNETGGSQCRTTTTTELKEEPKKGLTVLQTLRDEVRVKLHLASLELKDQWNKFEPHLGEIEKKAEALSDASRAAVVDAVKKIESFRSSLSEHR